MATLEVHDGRGRVEYITISRENTALFGADPKCDVVLDDPQALPFHGRLRWKNGKYRAEAFPEANALSINGKKVVASSLAQGDHIAVGSYKIYLANDDDDNSPDEASARPAEAKRPPAAKRGATPAAAPAGATATLAGPGAKPTVAAPPKKPGPIKKLLNVLNAKDQRPGEEKLVSSPLVLALVLALGLLIAVGIGLFSVIKRTTAERQFNSSMDAYKDKDYLNAMKGFDDFLYSNPHEPRAGKARVLRAMASVHQYVSTAAPNFTAALQAAADAYKKVGNEPEFIKDDQMNLADLVLKTSMGLADRSKAGADPKMLDEAMKAVTLHDRVAGELAQSLRTKSLLPQKLSEARAAVDKAATRTQYLANMDAAIKKKSATDVYNIRDSLVAMYADFATDKDLVAKLTSANDLLRANVKFDASSREAETTPQIEPLGPPLSLVLRSDPITPAGKSGTIVYALAQGFAYALDASNGAPLWHTPLGLSTPFTPIPVAGTPPTCLAYDARHGELVRLDGRTGKLLWRQTTGETITDPPLVKGNQVVQLTPSGKMLMIDLNSGALKGTLDLGRAAARTPASDEAGGYFYVAADRDVVYVISRDPLQCVSVEYLGHSAGSVPCAPAQVGPYLIVPTNDTLLDGRWSVFALDAEGAKLKKMQSIDIKGWTWSTPVATGQTVWSVTDRGQITAFSIGDVASRIPLRTIAMTVPDARPSGPAYGRSRTEKELWLSSHRAGRFDLSTEQSNINPVWTVERAGTALAPIQTATPLGILTQSYLERPGVAVWGVNFADKKIVWRTVLGTSWPLDPIAQPGGDGLSILSAEGKVLTIPKEKVQSGGFVEMPLPRAGYFYLPANPIQRIDAAGLTIVITAPDADHVFVREKDSKGDFRRVDLPAPLGAAPLFWDGDLFAPGLDGRVYLIDPRTGAAKAEPYVPPFERAKPTKWKAPVKLGDDAVILADASGRVRRLAKVKEPRLRLSVVGEVVDLKSAILGDPATTSEAVIVNTADGKIRALAGRDLSPLGAWSLDAPVAMGPASMGGHAVIVDGIGNAMAFGPDGQRIWSVALDPSPPLGPPILKDDVLWFLSRDGALQRRSLSDGSAVDRVELRILPTAGLNSDGPDVLVPSAPGTYRTFDPNGPKVAQP